MKPVIKEARKENMKNILKLIKECERYDVEFAERYYKRYFSESTDEITEKDKVYAAFDNEEVVGVIGYCRDYFATDYSYWLGWFVVSNKFRRNKVGTALLKQIETDLKKIRKRKIFVSTGDRNAPAKSFYTKNRFRTEGVIRDYYWTGEDQLIMSKLLEP